jgi:hypothetical protein
MRAFARGVLVGSFLLLPARSLFAQEALAQPVGLEAGSPVSQSPVNFLFRDQFYLSPSQKIRHNIFQADDFLVVERANPELNSRVAVVSGFAPQALRTRSLKGIQTVEEAKAWIEKHKKERPFDGVTIFELPLPIAGGRVQPVYWVGNKSFDSFDKAAAEVAMVRTLVESQGGDFSKALSAAEEFAEPEPVPTVEEVRARAQFQKEEEIMLRWIDQMNIGEDLFGPFQGVPAGEPILYQSFGEGDYRSTNLAQRKWHSFVAHWTNRIVFKGIKFPLNTLDPFVETTTALEATGLDGGSHLDLSVGVEWRPLQRNAFFENFNIEGIQLLKWVRNYRFYAQYFVRKNLKDEIAFSREDDFRTGVDIFYEWGIELPQPGQPRSKGIAGILQDYIWGEYFGNYGFRHTNFSTEENYDALLFETDILLGFKTPGIPLPQNPINDELVLMPYFRFSWSVNDELSNPFDNKAAVSVGVRWMPFRDYRFQNNEWLFKTKFFAEYRAIGKVRFLKQNQDNRPLPDEDWVLGVNISLRRF